MKWREIWLYMCDVTAGEHIFTKMIREDLSVIDILMKRKAWPYRDLGQSSPNRRNRKGKSPETRNGKAFFDF